VPRYFRPTERARGLPVGVNWWGSPGLGLTGGCVSWLFTGIRGNRRGVGGLRTPTGSGFRLAV